MDADGIEPVDAVVRRHTLATLGRLGGDKRAAAKALGVSPKTLYNWLNRWAAERPGPKPEPEPEPVAEPPAERPGPKPEPEPEPVAEPPPEPPRAGLTPAQRELAGSPEALALARRHAARYARRTGTPAEEAEAAALAGVALAARDFDPARGVKFTTFAAPRVAGAIVDAARELMPKGFRRSGGLAVVSLGRPAAAGRGRRAGVYARAPGRVTTLADVLPSGELPVGWEAESEDEVRALAGHLPPAYAAVVRAALLSAEHGGRQAAVGRALGVSESRVSQVLKASAELLRGT